jgi:outer membrane biosynthesis protein TonB
MSSQQPRKILRVGVLHNGTVVEERHFRHHEAVTFGCHFNNSLSFSAPDLPASTTLFESRGGRYYLNFDKALEGPAEGNQSRVAVRQGVHTLTHLRAQGQAEHRGDHWSVPLDETARGKLVVGRGDVVLLFQFIDAPRVAAPQLPSALRGGPLTFLNNTVELTGLLGLALLFSFLVQVGFVVYLVLEVPPPPRPVGLADLPDEIRMILTDARDTEQEELTQERSDDGTVIAESAIEQEVPIEDAPAEVEPPPEERPTPRQVTELAPPPERSRDEELRLARNLVREQSFFSPLAAPTDGGVGPAMNQIFNVTNTNVDSVLASQQARGEGGLAGRATSPLASDTAGGGGSGETVNVDIARSRTAERADAVSTGRERDRVRVEANIRQSTAQTAGSGRLDADSLNEQLRRRIRDVRRCYERVLAEEPSLGGRIVLQFTIGAGGRVDDVRLVENEVGPRVGDCIEGGVRRWRFDPPEGGSVTVRKTYILEPAN